DEDMLVDDILDTFGQDLGDEEDDYNEIGMFPTFDQHGSGNEDYTDGNGDGDDEEDDIDRDSLMDEEDVEEDVESLLMEDGISAAAGLVFAPNDLVEEISFWQSLSGYSEARFC